MPAPAQAAQYGQLILNNAATHYGQPYVYGATGPSSFDCSGFTGYIFRQFGYVLPRTSQDQSNAVTHIPQNQAQLGDLIFFYDGGGVYHVGIYAGNNQVYAATHTGDVVRPETIWTSSYYVGRPALGGAIGQHWQDLGGEYGVLGEATDLEYQAPNARKVDYQGGAIYWTPTTGAAQVGGAIAAMYNSIGASGGYLGVPVSDERDTPGGRANAFANGAIYWSPTTSAHAVQGAIGLKYMVLGSTGSLLGFPIGEEAAVPGGRVSAFQGGNIYWGPTTSAYEVHGPILDSYLARKGPAGGLGLPVSDVQGVPGGQQTLFQHGILQWNAATGKVKRLPR